MAVRDCGGILGQDRCFHYPVPQTSFQTGPEGLSRHKAAGETLFRQNFEKAVLRTQEMQIVKGIVAAPTPRHTDCQEESEVLEQNSFNSEANNHKGNIHENSVIDMRHAQSH